MNYMFNYLFTLFVFPVLFTRVLFVSTPFVTLAFVFLPTFSFVFLPTFSFVFAFSLVFFAFPLETFSLFSVLSRFGLFSTFLFLDGCTASICFTSLSLCLFSFFAAFTFNDERNAANTRPYGGSSPTDSFASCFAIISSNISLDSSSNNDTLYQCYLTIHTYSV